MLGDGITDGLPLPLLGDAVDLLEGEIERARHHPDGGERQCDHRH